MDSRRVSCRWQSTTFSFSSLPLSSSLRHHLNALSTALSSNVGHYFHHHYHHHRLKLHRHPSPPPPPSSFLVTQIVSKDGPLLL